MPNLKVVLVDENAPQPSPRRSRAPMLLIAAILLSMLSAYLGRVVGPQKLPDELSPVEAAKILKGQQGFAGYSLIKTEGDGGLGHDIFCPHCGQPIAEVRVAFLPEREPAVGSRIALLEDFAKKAIVNEANADQRKRATASSAPRPVVAYQK